MWGGPIVRDTEMWESEAGVDSDEWERGVLVMVGETKLLLVLFWQSWWLCSSSSSYGDYSLAWHWSFALHNLVASPVLGALGSSLKWSF